MKHELTVADEATPRMACSVDAVPEAQRQRWLQLGREFYAAVDHVEPIDHGYAFRVAPHQLLLAAEYVNLDRHCCSFLRWEICVDPGGGPTWLRVSGRAGTRAFLAKALEATALLQPEVAQRAGLCLDAPPNLDESTVRALADHINR